MYIICIYTCVSLTKNLEARTIFWDGDLPGFLDHRQLVEALFVHDIDGVLTGDRWYHGEGDAELQHWHSKVDATTLIETNGKDTNHIGDRYWPRRSWNITFRRTAKRVIFSQGIIFSREVRSTEGKYCPEGKYNSLGTTGTWYFICPGRYLLY